MKKLLIFLSAIAFLESCKKDEEKIQPQFTNTIPEFYNPAIESQYAQKQPFFVTIAGSEHRIADPQDLDFNPNRNNELWIINKGLESTGGSTVMLTETGTPNQQFDYRQDGNAWHFMSLPSAIAFSKNGNWATTANVLDANHSGGTFTGPTLWSSDLNIYAKNAGPGTNGSHLDMLHASPYSMGIASEVDNIFWVYDGFHGNIVKYDFVADHGPGMHYHGDAKIHRYPEVTVKRDPLVPSHMILDSDKRWLYIADAGNNRIIRMDIQTGTKTKDLELINEELTEYWEMGGVVWEEVLNASSGLNKPCGIDLKDNRLFVSEYETGDIICIDLVSMKEMARIKTGEKGIMGIKIGPDHKLYYVNALGNKVVRVDPK